MGSFNIAAADTSPIWSMELTVEETTVASSGNDRRAGSASMPAWQRDRHGLSAVWSPRGVCHRCNISCNHISFNIMSFKKSSHGTSWRPNSALKTSAKAPSETFCNRRSLSQSWINSHILSPRIFFRKSWDSAPCSFLKSSSPWHLSLLYIYVWVPWRMEYINYASVN